ncbi:MAG: chemotaxis protein CheW [Candidatus Methylacidiphilales bacterium]
MSADSNHKPFLLLRNGVEIRAVHASSVTGDVHLPQITPIPLLPPWFLGVCLQGSEMIPLFSWGGATAAVPFSEEQDSEAIGGWTLPVPATSARMILLGSEDTAFGLPADEVELLPMGEIEGIEVAPLTDKQTALVVRGGQRCAILDPVAIAKRARSRLARLSNGRFSLGQEEEDEEIVQEEFTD